MDLEKIRRHTLGALREVPDVIGLLGFSFMGNVAAEEIPRVLWGCVDARIPAVLTQRPLTRITTGAGSGDAGGVAGLAGMLRGSWP
ncbi:hypothetical protein [Amycolatopsis sp. NPDC051372]|uniref:hypothetical protein n=1 Tax=unclassified Amycolatopsis TaxID=2618356 RepID=UPI0034151BD8